ncbi:MAG: hypothetical protein OSJ43_15695 [Oscillospiraceae bacterium]|nr:hypothetical protein [Oscillospiraceae bacterium]
MMSVNSENDMDVLDFARKISMLDTDTKISNEFDIKYGQKNNRWWHCQREHLTVWCLHYPTGGVHGYNHRSNNSAKYMYYHFGRPETLLWLAEALNECDDLLNSLVEEIKDKAPSSACGDIRREIPFNRILRLLEQKNL